MIGLHNDPVSIKGKILERKAKEFARLLSAETDENEIYIKLLAWTVEVKMLYARGD